MEYGPDDTLTLDLWSPEQSENKFSIVLSHYGYGNLLKQP